jgi:tetrahydromethanopterin S-methyltransferase subunit F
MTYSTHDFKGRDLELYREALNDRRLTMEHNRAAVTGFVCGILLAALLMLAMIA